MGRQPSPPQSNGHSNSNNKKKCKSKRKDKRKRRPDHVEEGTSASGHEDHANSEDDNAFIRGVIPFALTSASGVEDETQAERASDPAAHPNGGHDDRGGDGDLDEGVVVQRTHQATPVTVPHTNNVDPSDSTMHGSTASPTSPISMLARDETRNGAVSLVGRTPAIKSKKKRKRPKNKSKPQSSPNGTQGSDSDAAVDGCSPSTQQAPPPSYGSSASNGTSAAVQANGQSTSADNPLSLATPQGLRASLGTTAARSNGTATWCNGKAANPKETSKTNGKLVHHEISKSNGALNGHAKMNGQTPRRKRHREGSMEKVDTPTPATVGRLPHKHQEQRKSLPIYEHKAAIIEAIKVHQVEDMATVQPLGMLHHSRCTHDFAFFPCCAELLPTCPDRTAWHHRAMRGSPHRSEPTHRVDLFFVRRCI